jgi:hypothetical protein
MTPDATSPEGQRALEEFARSLPVVRALLGAEAPSRVLVRSRKSSFFVNFVTAPPKQPEKAEPRPK